MHEQTPTIVLVLMSFFIVAIIPLLLLAAVSFWADTRRLYAKKGDSFKMVISRMLNITSDL